MRFLKFRIAIISGIVVLLAGSFVTVAYAEREKAVNKQIQNSIASAKDFEDYRKQLLADEKQTREKFVKEMADAKSQYLALLQQQQDIINAHTKVVPVTSTQQVPVDTGSSQSGSSSTKVSSSTTSSSQKSSKPKSTRSTKTS